MHTFKINRNTLYILIILALTIGVALLLPALKQSVSGTAFLGSETYYHLNNLEEPTDFFERMLSVFVHFTNESTVVLYLPIVLLILTFLLITSIFKNFQESDTEYFYALIILILSPAFIAAYLGLTLAGIILFATTLTLFLYLRSSYFYLLSLALLYLLDPLLGVLLTIFFLVKELREKNHSSIFVLILSLTILLIATFSTNVHTLLINQQLLTVNFDTVFSFFGARYGITLFLLSLGILGIMRTLKTYPFVTMASSLIIVLSLFYEPARLLGVVSLVVFSAKAFNHLVKRKWEVPYIGQLVLILFLCMLLFSTAIFVKGELQQEPTKEDLEHLEFLKTLHLDSQAKLLLMPSQAEYTTYYSQRKIFASTYRSKNESTLALELFSSRDYAYVKEILQENNIGLILVDEKTVTYLKKPEEGLLFVMKNNDNFLKLYQTKNTIIYYFKLWNE